MSIDRIDRNWFKFSEIYLMIKIKNIPDHQGVTLTKILYMVKNFLQTLSTNKKLDDCNEE